MEIDIDIDMFIGDLHRRYVRWRSVIQFHLTRNTVGTG
jgi:hypothetical protein